VIGLLCTFSFGALYLFSTGSSRLLGVCALRLVETAAAAVVEKEAAVSPCAVITPACLGIWFTQTKGERFRQDRVVTTNGPLEMAWCELQNCDL